MAAKLASLSIVATVAVAATLSIWQRRRGKRSFLKSSRDLQDTATVSAVLKNIGVNDNLNVKCALYEAATAALLALPDSGEEDGKEVSSDLAAFWVPGRIEVADCQRTAGRPIIDCLDKHVIEDGHG